MGKRDLSYMDQATQLQLHIDAETEQFLCKVNDDSEWRLYGYELDGTRTTVTYEVTDEIPPDRAVILRNWDTGEEFEVRWTITVDRRERSE